jgi:hypothetical protein
MGISATVWSPFLGYLFWRDKKGDWLSAHTRPAKPTLAALFFALNMMGLRFNMNTGLRT